MRVVNPSITPRSLQALADGRLSAAVEAAAAMATCCVACGWRCRVDRRDSHRLGVCRTGTQARVASYCAHPGEEAVLSGQGGSGTIFFSGCNLRCQYCQNYEISQFEDGQEVREAELAGIMLELQARGCHNINLVSPTHVLHAILAALPLALQGGLRIPIVWNTGGYESQEALALLDGLVDIYMPDMKYGNDRTAQRLSKSPRYTRVNQAAVREMHRQVGDLVVGSDGLAVQGLLVRHLVLPGGLAGTETVMRFLAEEISPNTAVNIMDQYHPAWQAQRDVNLRRRPHREEISAARQAAIDAGLRRVEPDF